MHSKFRSYVHDLECLWRGGTHFRRTRVNAFRNEYVALSYTWTPSEHEDQESGQYCVEDWDCNTLEPSKVRNCIFERILRYMDHVGAYPLWIDAHCIYQDACDTPGCGHARCTQKREALQAMDLVYQLSSHPVALLGRPLRTEAELHLLARILGGDFVTTVATNIRVAREALHLLHEITRDSWWGRAWTFQENYRGGERMRLLIRHDPSLERQKLRYLDFDKIPGELCIASVLFSQEATRLCLALQRMADLPPDDKASVDNVLRAAGRYSIALSKSRTMTPTVIADIQARGLSKPWDRLPIVANCCQYSVRLDGEALSQQRQSISLSVLAMCLLNGEIIDNGNNRMIPAANLTPSKFLEEYVFQGFIAPTDEDRRLTFNKSCRLTAVELTASGIATNGHLWKLGRVIDTARFREKLPWINNKNGRLELEQRRCLLQLVLELAGLGYDLLADKIDRYLAADADAEPPRYEFKSFTDMYLHRMATELVAAIEARKKLRLGTIWDPTGQSTPYRAVFVWPGERNDAADLGTTFVFTSVWEGNLGSYIHDANDIDRHVSLEVDLESHSRRGGVPRLRVRRGLLGMCFFDGCPRTRVVFPWPRALQGI